MLPFKTGPSPFSSLFPFVSRSLSLSRGDNIALISLHLPACWFMNFAQTTKLTVSSRAPRPSVAQARVLLLQLLWDKIEGSILGERRSKRAAAESRAAATIQQLSHIRRIAVGLIKVRESWGARFLQRAVIPDIALLCLVPLRVLPQTLCVSSGHHSSPTRRRSSRPPTQARHDVRRTRARLAEYVHLLGCKQASSRPTHLVIACSLARNTRVLSYRESLDYAHRLGTYRFRFPEYSTCIPSGCKHGYLGEEAIVMGCSGLVSNHRQQFFAQYKCALFRDAVATRAYVTDDHNGNNKAMTMSGTLGCLGCSRRCKAARRRLSWSTNPGRRKGIQWQNPARVDANRFETRPEENAPLRPPSKLARRKPSATPSSG